MFITYSKNNRKKSLILAIAMLIGIVGSTLIQDELNENSLVKNDCECEIEKIETKEAGFCFNLLVWNSCKPKGERWFWK